MDEPSITTQRLRGLAQAGLAYAEARVQLLQIETQEAGHHLGGIAIAAIIGLGSLAAAWLLIIAGLVKLMSGWLAWSWEHIAVLLGVLHLLVAAVALRRAASRWQAAQLYEESINQLHQDRAWIARGTQPQQR